MSNVDQLYKRLRHETATELLGYTEPLTVAQSVQTDVVVTLRLSLDYFSGCQLRGEAIDFSKMLSVADTLQRLLPRQKVEVAEGHNARGKLRELIAGIGAAADAEENDQIAALQAQLTEKDALLAAKDQLIAGEDAVIASLGGSLSAPPQAAKAALDQPPKSQPPSRSSSAPPSHYLADHSQPWRQGEAGFDRWRNNQ